MRMLYRPAMFKRVSTYSLVSDNVRIAGHESLREGIALTECMPEVAISTFSFGFKSSYVRYISSFLV